jgi:hypothetical protein
MDNLILNETNRNPVPLIVDTSFNIADIVLEEYGVGYISASISSTPPDAFISKAVEFPIIVTVATRKSREPFFIY